MDYFERRERRTLVVPARFAHENAVTATRKPKDTTNRVEMREKWAGADSNCGYGHPKAEGYQATPPARRFVKEVPAYNSSFVYAVRTTYVAFDISLRLDFIQRTMATQDLVEFVDRALGEEAKSEFDRRVAEQGRDLTETIKTGELDNPGFGIGIELEVYAVDDTGSLARLPLSIFEAPCNKELGLHNAEINTVPDPFDAEGLSAQAEKLRQNYRATRRAGESAGRQVVLDAMWSVPPGEGTHSYLGDVQERDGVVVAENMSSSARYIAIDNDILRRTGGRISLSIPGIDQEFPSILCESLTSSIQPHLQIPAAADLPAYHNVALATTGPVLALTTNSPLAPVDLYDVEDPRELLTQTSHELRIPVFEGSINDAWEKVRFPERIETTPDVVDSLVADPTCAPVLREMIAQGQRETFADRFWELDHKRGTFWRWVRAVPGGQPVGEGDERSIRIEYRPIPTQPSIEDNISVLALVTGALRGLVDADHPVTSLERDDAKTSFYNAVSDGIDAEMVWITADGEKTTDSAVIYEELFGFAREGLRAQGISDSKIDGLLAPIERRWVEKSTPSQWKLDRVRDGLDRGLSFEEAVREMQQTYVERMGSETPFVEWVA